jgi:hypothetical protein
MMELPLKPEDLPERYESCPEYGSKKLRHFTYHDPDEYYSHCQNCGREEWSVPTTSPTNPAQDEEEDFEDEEEDFEDEEDFEIEELTSAFVSGEDFSQGCPECGGWDIEVTPLGVNWQTKPDYYLVLCTNCTEKWWFVDKLPTALIPKEESVKSEVIELLPIPRDFSNLKQLPEWWERPLLPDMENPDCPIGDDEDDWQYALEFEFFFKVQYRGWLIEINDEKIYGTEPNGKKCWWCECDLDIDGRDGQIAIAQEFIDSWYFAQPSPGQLSLNIIETVVRDPPPPRLTA